ncbi:MAG TPA: hypothetical protein VF784_16495, partial [Anaerolineales bacterium]
IATGHLWLMIACMLLLIVAYVALFRMLGSVVLGTKPDNIARGETGFTTLAPILILMILVVALGVTMPAPMSTLLDGAARVVNTGNAVAQTAAPGMASSSILAPFGGADAPPLISLFRVQPGK